MSEGLDPGPVNPQPFSVGVSLVPNFDVIELLASAPGAADRLRAIRQNFRDKSALNVPFADISAASTARIQAEARLKQLRAHRSRRRELRGQMYQPRWGG